MGKLRFNKGNSKSQESNESTSSASNPKSFERPFERRGKAHKASSKTSRRDRRQKSKQINAICFLCREKGHFISHCPKNTTPGDGPKKNNSQKICYRCGSNDHPVQQCSKKFDPQNPYPFAECFVCNGTGHLAGQCPENQKGLYPMGGGCRFCGSVRHLARDCKPAQQEKGIIALEKMDIRQGGDDDVEIAEVVAPQDQASDDDTPVVEKAPPKPAKSSGMKKVVKF